MAEENKRSIADVLEDIVANVQQIIRSEVRLAKTEVAEEAVKAGRATSMLAGGGIAALFTVWLLLLTIFLALAIVIPMWSSALLLFIVMAALSATLIMIGKKRFKAINPKPEKTIESVKENVEWLKNQAK
jgi:uncharacterized membrane protein YqjE